MIFKNIFRRGSALLLTAALLISLLLTLLALPFGGAAKTIEEIKSQILKQENPRKIIGIE